MPTLGYKYFLVLNVLFSMVAILWILSFYLCIQHQMLHTQFNTSCSPSNKSFDYASAWYPSNNHFSCHLARIWDIWCHTDELYVNQHQIATLPKSFPDEGCKKYRWTINFTYDCFHTPYTRSLVIYDHVSQNTIWLE